MTRAVAAAWPLPALAVWAIAWLSFVAARTVVGTTTAFVAAFASGLALAAIGSTPWRRAFVVSGFPLSFLLTGTSVPAWTWLLPLVLVALAYPARAWRDAPLFPTPHGALDTLARQARLDPGARILDAGCGVGDGLLALRRAYPEARLEGIEWSLPWRLASAWRCRFATVSRGDLWALDWSPYALVYVFQRPESMARAHAKAEAELRDGSWLASLEFAVPDVRPTAIVRCADGRDLHLYRISSPTTRRR